MEILKDGVCRLASMDKISWCGWHVQDREENQARERTTFIVQDKLGNTLETPLPRGGGILSQQAYILIMLTVLRVIKDNGGTTESCYPNNWSIVENINRARQVAPYTGKLCINEHESRLYDSRQREYIL